MTSQDETTPTRPASRGNTPRSHATLSGRVLKIMGIFSGVQIITILCSVIRTKLVAVWLGPAGMGLFGLYYSATETIGSLAQMSMGIGVVRELAVTPRQGIARLVKVIRRWGFALGMLGALATLALSPWLSRFTFGDDSHTLGFIILSASVFFIAVSNNESAVFQGMREYSALARATVGGALLGLALSVPMYYFWGLDSIVPSLLVYAAATWACRGLFRYKTAPAGPVSLRETLTEGKSFALLGMYVTITSFATNAASYIFMSYLNTRAGTETAGFYQAGFTLVNRYVGLVLAAIGMEYLPRLSQVNASPMRVRAFLSHEIVLILLVMFPVVTIFVTADELIVRILYDGEFLVMLPFITWAVIGTVFRAWSWCIAFVILARNDGKAFLVTELISSAVAIGLNILFYDRWGIAGMGYAYTLWYIIYTLTVWGVCRRRYGLRMSAGAVRLPLAVFLFCVAAALCRSWWGWWGALPFALVSIAASAAGLQRLLGLSPGKIIEKFVRPAKKE